MFALYHEELLLFKKKKMFLSNVFICGMKVICNNIVPSVFVYMSLAEHVQIVFHLLGAPLFSSFGIVAFSKGYVQVFKSSRSGVIIQLYFFFMIVPNSHFLLAINHSCMPLKEKSRLLLPFHDFCSFSNSVTALLYH